MSRITFSRSYRCFPLAMALVASAVSDVHAENSGLESTLRKKSRAIEEKLIAWRRTFTSILS